MKPVIQAGAGTGKTFHIVELLVDALVEKRIDPSHLMALTFTVKAANEMRERLADRLQEEKRDRELAMIDRMEIGTIHSFASHVLKQFPVEAEVSPGFKEDEGAAFEALFRDRWPRWFRGQTPEFLDRVEPGDLSKFVRKLCEPEVPLTVRAFPGWKAMVKTRAGEADELLRRHGENRQADNLRSLEALRYMIDVFHGSADPRRARILSDAGKRPKVLKGQSGSVPEWSDEDWASFQDLKSCAGAVVETDDELLGRILSWLRPFVLDFRAEYARRGFVSFDGLLAHAARLLCGNRDVRDHFKERFRLILVDEFQDTDPLQGEMLLYLAERRGQFERDWRSVQIEPGKLVLVGDPKQSIYLFRGADLESYRAITQKLTGGDDTRVDRLSMSWRSKREIVEYVNGVCGKILKEPAYEALVPNPKKGEGARIEAIVFPDLKAEDARKAEAEAIADWILEQKLEFGTVAILLRSLNDAGFYTYALRRRGIPYAIDGGKSFWNEPEVVDFTNLLTAIAHPTHEPAVAGLLRSPLGAVADRDLLRLREAGALSPLQRAHVPKDLGHVRELYEAVAELHALSRRIRAGELVRRVVRRFPLREIWAATYRGEQAVANLEKLAWELERVGSGTISEALFEVRRRTEASEEQAESPLADEKLDAVRILSIHKSKGLEFPVVVAADLHRGRRKRESRDGILRHWLEGRVGMKVGNVRSTEQVLLEREYWLREEEERARLLYVALTRAKERLLLTGGESKEENFLGALLEGPGVVVRPPPQRQQPLRPLEVSEEPDPVEENRRWNERERKAEEVRHSEAIRKPSASREERDREFRWEGDEEVEGAREVGTLCHDILEHADFSAMPQVTGEAGEILNVFFKTEAFREIATADRILREVPFILQHEGQVWSGQIDVLYQRDGRWIVADYKTDREEHPERYALQKEIYVEAARRALGLAELPEFRLIYLRSSRTVIL